MYYKGIIVEIQDKYIIVMDEGGEFIKLKKKDGASIGDAIFFTEEDIVKEKSFGKVLKLWTLPLATAAVIFISLISVLINFNTKNTPYALLSFDINPSFSIEVNKDDTIVKVSALNEDAKNLDINKLKNKPLNEALKVVKAELDSNNNFKDKNSLIVGFSFLEGNKNIQFEDNVKKVIDENFNGFKIVYVEGDKKDEEEARKAGLSLGKYSINKGLNNKFSEDELKNVPVDEIINRFDEENGDKDYEDEIEDEDDKEDSYENDDKEDVEDSKEDGDEKDKNNEDKIDSQEDEDKEDYEEEKGKATYKEHEDKEEEEESYEDEEKKGRAYSKDDDSHDDDNIKNYDEDDED